MNNSNSYERYHRQLILPKFGEAAQQKLLNARVLVVGAGGLGCPILQYLTAAGVGTIGIVDDDTVQLNNLQRQVLYSVNDLGLPKADRASSILNQLNSEIQILPFNQRLTNENALRLFEEFQIIVDASDNFPTRYLINDSCAFLKKPLVFGAISQYEGQLSIFRNETANDVNYRDLFPQPPKDGEVLSCAEGGVLGVLAGIIGTMMANETIKLITGIGSPLINRLLTFNSLNNQFYELSLSVRPECRSLIPKTAGEFEKRDYEWLCSSQLTNKEIDAGTFNNFIANEQADVIDVREPNELPEVNEFSNMKIPLSTLAGNTSGIKSNTVVTFCQTGKRSIQAVQILDTIFNGSKRIYSLKGGILEWKKQKQ